VDRVNRFLQCNQYAVIGGHFGDVQRVRQESFTQRYVFSELRYVTV